MESANTGKPSFSHRRKSVQFSISQRLLTAWVRPTILNCDESLGIQPDDTVCYVLPFKSISDLLLVDSACAGAGLPRPVDSLPGTQEKRSFFFLGHPEGRFGRKTQRRQSARMIRLFDHQAPDARPIKIVPVSLFWGHQPSQEKSIFRLLLSENWTATSRFRKFFAMLFLRSHILVQFNPPILLHEITANTPEQGRQIRKLMRVLRVHFTRQRQAILGPDLSHRRTLISNMVSSTLVKQAITDESQRQEKSVDELTQTAVAYANEIVSHQSYRVIRFFHVLLTWLWNRLYDGIDVHNVNQVKLLSGTHEIVYTPCHRSHIDYLLLSYVLYQNGLTPPHVAAGNNLNLPVIGGLLRRAGAFFMRRSFQGDDLYRAVFDQYLHLMFTKGYSVEFFIEGGRSRTGRTLKPKTGMLAMTLRSFLRNSSKPIALMPVYFNYQKVIEAPTYLSELSGRHKKPESMFDIFKIFSALKLSFGRVTVNFGEPVKLPDFLNDHWPDWQTGLLEDDAVLSSISTSIATRLVTNINKAGTINSVNLVATALLATRRQTMAENRLLDQIRLLRDIAARLPGVHAPVVTLLSEQDILAEAEKIAGLERLEQQLGNLVLAPSATIAQLTYYRNMCIHWFVVPSLLARLVKTHQPISQDELLRMFLQIYPYLQAELYLPYDTEDIEALVRDCIALLASQQLIVVSGHTVAVPDYFGSSYASLSDLAEIVEPSLERFHIVLSLLQQNPTALEDTLETRAAAIAEYLATIYGINSPEFFDRALFVTFVNALISQKLAVRNDNNISLTTDLSATADQIKAILEPDLNYHLQQALVMFKESL